MSPCVSLKSNPQIAFKLRLVLGEMLILDQVDHPAMLDHIVAIGDCRAKWKFCSTRSTVKPFAFKVRMMVSCRGLGIGCDT